MTEEEAKTKRCPLGEIKVTDGYTNSFGKVVHTSKIEPAYCMASDCMMWREHDNPKYDFGGYCGLTK